MVSSYCPNKLFLSLFTISLLACSSIAHDFSILGYSPEDLTCIDKLIILFESWLAKHGKVYESIEEKLHRFEIFKDNLKHIDETNKKVTDYWLGLNEFADLSHEEFKSMYLGLKPTSSRSREAPTEFSYNDVIDLPASVDWRKKGAVTSIKNQGGCEDDYPYLMEEGKCEFKKETMEVVTINGYEDVPQNDEKSLLKALSHQPVSVAIEASGRDFQFYKGGIFNGHCGTELDHGVTAVGYGQDYIIVKNSWGLKWGEKGYIRMKRNTGKPEGLCGINKMASYPTKKK
ncbi:hypothetical protein Sjap_017605 [Stephania japonica]|uniref:Uncharacterized protein n=1 Tax=Stephania japonica TaxID=461633 RepID=A0AAP0I6K2_9MAGN